MRTDIDFATSVISKALLKRRSLAARMEAAVQQRQEIQAMLKAGMMPESARYQTMVQVAQDFLTHLANVKEEFEGVHPHEHYDFEDGLQSLQLAYLLIKRTQKTLEALDSVVKPLDTPKTV